LQPDDLRRKSAAASVKRRIAHSADDMDFPPGIGGLIVSRILPAAALQGSGDDNRINNRRHRCYTPAQRGLAMRRTILLSLFALLGVSLANDACAQRRGGAGIGFTRGGYGFSRVRAISPYGFGYANLPYDSGAAYGYVPQPVLFVQQPPVFVQPPAPPVVEPPVHPVIKDYKWPAAGAASSPSAPSTTSESEPQTFAIVLKDGSTLSAVSVFASDDGLHFVDPDERHLRISMSEVDRGATLKLNRARNLNLYLPASE
jgi:hypothetical protein